MRNRDNLNQWSKATSRLYVGAELIAQKYGRKYMIAHFRLQQLKEEVVLRVITRPQPHNYDVSAPAI